MKIICLLLSFYAIMLSAKPCCADNDCRLKANEKVSKQASDGKEFPGCSPFFTCGSCIGFIVRKPLIVNLSAIAENIAKEYPSYEQLAVQKIPLSIWLPPELS